LTFVAALAATLRFRLLRKLRFATKSLLSTRNRFRWVARGLGALRPFSSPGSQNYAGNFRSCFKIVFTLFAHMSEIPTCTCRVLHDKRFPHFFAFLLPCFNIVIVQFSRCS